MEKPHHPLVGKLTKLLRKCAEQQLNCKRALITCEAFLSLSLDEKLTDVDYCFDESLKVFYLRGSNKSNVQFYVPISVSDKVTLTEISSIQKNLSLKKDNFQFIILNEDSSFTCYNISKGLVKPDSPCVCKLKKKNEEKRFQLVKEVQVNKKQFYSKALNTK